MFINARSEFQGMADTTNEVLQRLDFVPVTWVDQAYDHDERRLWARPLAAPQAIQSVSLHTRHTSRQRALVHVNIWFKLTRLFESRSQFEPVEFPPERRDLVPDDRSSVAVRLNMDAWLRFAPEPVGTAFSRRKDLNLKIRPDADREERIEQFNAMLTRCLVPVLQRRWTEIELARLGWEGRDYPREGDPPSIWQLLAYLHDGQIGHCLKLIQSNPRCLGSTRERWESARTWFQQRMSQQ